MRAVATVPVLPPPPGGSVLEGAALPPYGKCAGYPVKATVY